MNKKIQKHLAIIGVIVGIFPQLVNAQPHISVSDRQQLLNSIFVELDARYVLPDKLVGLQNQIQNTISSELGPSTNCQQLAEFITKKLYTKTQDKHLGVYCDHQWATELIEKNKLPDNEAYADTRALETPRANYGFKTIDILDGNIGYLDLRSFADSHLAGDTAIAAMSFLGNTAGIIIDLRNNFGGSPYMLEFLASYFFDAETQLLLEGHFRERGETNILQSWTTSFVPGTRHADTPLYILVGNMTASAAEGFAFALQDLGRATVIGQQTAGAGHGRNAIAIDEHFVLTLPTMRYLSPRTQTNWENVGVTPDIKTTKEKAFDMAYATVLEQLVSRGDTQQAFYSWYLEQAKAKLRSDTVDLEQLKRFVGSYDGNKLFMREEQLFIELYGLEFKLIPITPTRFQFANVSDTKLDLIEHDGLRSLRLFYLDGEERLFKQTVGK